MYIGSHHNYRAKNSNARDIIPQRKFGLEVLKQKLPTIVKNSKIIVFFVCIHPIRAKASIQKWTSATRKNLRLHDPWELELLCFFLDIPHIPPY